jgi:5'(3')-deoxyribonucleotidase
MTKPKIFVDVDGCLVDFATSYLSVLLMQTGRYHSHAQVTDFDFTKCVASPAEDDAVWRHIDRTPGFVTRLQPMDGAITALAELRTLGTVRALTAPHLGPTWMHERSRWLLSAGFTKREIIFCSDKPLVPGDVFIEDRKDTCEAWQEAHPDSLAILFDQPHNQGASPCIRARGWPEAVAMVRARLASAHGAAYCARSAVT